MNVTEELREIPVHGLARLRDIDEFLTEWILPGDDENTQQRIYLAYLRGMIDTHIRASKGEEPGLEVVETEEVTDGTKAEHLYRNKH